MAALRIHYLADKPEAVGVVAEWFAREWGDGSPSRTVRAYAEQLAKGADRDRLPISLVGFLGNEAVATATLKYREIEYATEADFWVGWVCVREDMRGRGLGAALMNAIEDLAASRGNVPLYLHSPTEESFYRRLGWRPVGVTVVGSGHSTVMTKMPSSVNRPTFGLWR